MKRHLAWALCAVALIASPAQAQQNLVRNSGFDTNLSNWEGDAFLNSWSPLDASGSASSGSARVQIPSAQPPGFAEGVRQCIPVVANRSYRFGGRTFIAAGQTTLGTVTFALVWFSTPGCGQASSLGFASSDGRTLPSGWATAEKSGARAPSGAQGAQLQGYITRPDRNTDFVVHFDDLFVYEENPTTIVIPSTASIHGSAGTFFQTDLWLANRSYAATLTVSARYRCFTGQTCAQATKVLSILPRRSIQLVDAVGTFFAAPETAGAIELTYDASVGSLSALARVYTPSLPAPTNGTAEPALAPSDARTRALFLGLGSNGGDLTSGFRSNAGVYNPGEVAATVTFTLSTAEGVLLGRSLTQTWQPKEARQINNIFREVGAGDAVATNAYLVVTSTAPVFPYVTVIDNQSGDSVFVPMSGDEPAP